MAKYEMDVAMLQHHMEHGRLERIQAEASGGGWTAFCVTKDPAYSATLMGSRGAPRHFKTADALINAIRNLEDDDSQATPIVF